MTSRIRGIAVYALMLGMVGCQDGGTSGSKMQSGAGEKSPSANQTKADAQAAPVQTASHNAARNDESATPQPTDDFESDASKRAQTENMIYATIRLKMEEAIEKRAALLKSGREPSDVEVRNLEGTIMRARDLLEENGEVVEAVDPPIVQSSPNP